MKGFTTGGPGGGGRNGFDMRRARSRKGPAEGSVPASDLLGSLLGLSVTGSVVCQ